MERLAMHIQYLLLRHDCVVVPGIGAFIKVFHPARVCKENGTLLPMTSEVRFNGALRHDDGMLAASYARRERLTFAECRESVRIAISSLRDALDADGEVPVGRLGSLRRSPDGNISFIPASSPEAVAERLGFFPLSVPAVQAAALPAAEDAERQTAETGCPRRFDTSRFYYIAVNKRLAHYAAMLCVVALVCVSVLLPFRQQLHEDQASIVPVRAISETIARPDSHPRTDSRNLAPRASVPVAPKAKPRNWHLIVATFRTRAEADKFIADTDAPEYCLSVVPGKTLFRVSARDADSKQALLDILNSDGFRSQFSQAWIYNSAD